jgi:hypothetical protein
VVLLFRPVGRRIGRVEGLVCWAWCGCERVDGNACLFVDVFKLVKAAEGVYEQGRSG